MTHSSAVAGLILISIGIYFVPSCIGMHKKFGWSIFALNLLIGWTILGWVGALVWSIASPLKEARLGRGPAEPKLCPQCTEKNGRGMSRCWKCGFEFAAAVSV